MTEQPRDDAYQVVVLTEDGQPAYVDGRPMTVDQLVQAFVKSNPHMVRGGAAAMAEQQTTIEVQAEQVETLTAALATAIDPAGAQQYISEQTKEFFDPNGKYRFAPDREKQKALDAAEAEFKTQQGQALYKLEVAIRDVTPAVEQAMADAQEPPDAETVWRPRMGRDCVSGTELINLEMLDEIRLARLRGDLANMVPSEVARFYERAQRDPNQQLNATTIRVIEAAALAPSWPGRSSQDDRELAALQQLVKQVQATRQKRIPASVRRALAALTVGRRQAQLAKDAAGVRPVKVDK